MTKQKKKIKKKTTSTTVKKLKKSSNVEKIKNIQSSNKKTVAKPIKTFPKEFPFWARFKLNKNRTTLIIDEELVLNKKSNKLEDCFVYREATHTKKNKEYEEIYPNPDTSDEKPMYLKRPRKHPKRLFSPHNKELKMPEDLRSHYEKNNKK